MANVLYIDGVPYPLGAKVVDDDGNVGVIGGYDTGDVADTLPLIIRFKKVLSWYGPNASGKYRVHLLNPPAPSETLSDMAEEHNADDEPEATV